MATGETLQRAVDGLQTLQLEDGRFEGRLTSNAYPTLACMLIDLLEGRPLDDGYRRWLINKQLPDGRYPLDPEGRASDEATRFARVVLQASLERADDAELRAALDNIPLHDWKLWFVKAFAALVHQYDWSRLPPPKSAEIVGRVAGSLLAVLPRTLFAKIKPPTHMAPPVSLFGQKAFEKMFLAEQYALAPMLLLIEAHTKRRPSVMKELTAWILARQAKDGSWFCVTFITAVATMALIVAQNLVPEERVARPLERAMRWLVQTRNPDGGHREAVSLNVWDTSLAAFALMDAGISSKSDAIRDAAAWLARVQNTDGGWSFHGLRGRGLPSDADDTALATLVLLRAGERAVAAERGVEWLRARQAKDGSWSTYAPEIGDVGCVSVTAHAVETTLLSGDRSAAMRGVGWLERAQNADGSWDDLWLAKKTYGTATALIALSKVGVADSRRAQRGLDWLVNAQNADGGWGETQSGEPSVSAAEQTAFAVQALRACGRNADAGIEWLESRQREDGGWDASPIGVYWEVIGGYANPINAWVFPIFALNESSEP